MKDNAFISIWETNRAKNFNIIEHTHNYYELVYYKFGSGKTGIGDKLFNFSTESFAIIPPNIRHNELHNIDGGVICLSFTSNQKLSIGLYNDNNRDFLKILQELMYEVKKQDISYRRMLNIKLEELLLKLNRLTVKKTNKKDFDYVINFLSSNYHENIILADCAKQLNLSYDYFQHKFKEETGFSPQQFLINKRLKAAEKMLITTNHSCTYISYHCGFSTSAQFSAMFKNKYGITPLQYKKKHI